MAIKIGDRVRFLNSIGGGIVSKFINKEMVNVLEDDGFETPILIRECVIIENINTENNLPKKDSKSTTNTSKSTEFQDNKKQEKEVVELFDETPEGEQLTVALAFVPQDIKNLQTSAYDFYFINDSNYSLYYTISTVSEEKAKMMENGLIHLNTTSFLKEISKEQLNDFEKLNIQFVAFKIEKTYSVKPSISYTAKLKLVNFFKLHSFTENDYFDEPAMIVPIITKDRLEIPLDLNTVDFNQLIKEKERKEEKIVSQKIEKKSVIEVDLHIHELLDTTAGMNPADLLEYQLKKFNETMLQYKTKKGQRIVFIHGKGNGVLRNELLKELKKKYPTCTYQDASFKEYGFGATLITIK